MQDTHPVQNKAQHCSILWSVFSINFAFGFFDNILFTIFSFQGIPESWADFLQMSNISLPEQKKFMEIVDMLNLRLLTERKV